MGVKHMNNDEKILGMLETLTTDITGIKSDITEMKADITGLKADMTDVKADITGLKADMTGVKNRLNNVELVIVETNDRVRNVEQIAVGIESEHGRILDALTDGFMNCMEKLTRIENRVLQHDNILLRRV
jgi:predicted  nucleic acid-binding Zn-ribbon protein